MQLTHKKFFMAVKDKIKQFSEEVIVGKRKGYTDKPFTDIVNIKISQSLWGF